MYEPKKRCVSCGELKYEGDFAIGRNQCAPCRRSPEQTRQYNRQQQSFNKHMRLINSSRNRSVQKRLPFDLDRHRDEIRDRIYNGVCELSGLPFDLTAWKAATWNSPSIDRVVPELGYILFQYSDHLPCVEHGLR